MPDVFANFSGLDELTQVIYQSIYKFVVHSNVNSGGWTIHVGLSGPGGRWWQGSWREADLHRILGSKLSDRLLETFAEKLAQVFIQGELCLTNWNPERGTEIKFTLGPASKKPMHIPLVEMTAEEAASYATSVFLDIALQAQSRSCRLYPLPTDTSNAVISSAVPGKVTSSSVPTGTASTSTTHVPTKRRIADTADSEERGSNSTTKAEGVRTNHASGGTGMMTPGKEGLSSTTKSAAGVTAAAEPPATPSRPPKGSSLANPVKKARKIQAIEFESDEE